MKEKEIKIEIPKGYEIDKEKSTFERIVFKKKTELLKKWEDLGAISGYYVDAFSNTLNILNHGKSVDKKTISTNKNVFKTKKQAQASIALAQLSQLMHVYNDGWTPNWKNRGENKFVINFIEDEINVNIHHLAQEFLTFKDSKLRAEFLKNFKDLILQAKPLL